MDEALQQSTSLTGLGMVFLAVTAAFTFSLPRQKAMYPLLATVCYMPLGQQVVIGGLNFTLVRLLILLGVLRVILRREAQGLTLNRLDKLVGWWAIATVLLGLAAEPSVKMFVNRMGLFYNAIGIYFLASCWIRDSKAFMGCLRFLAFLAIPLATFMLMEKATGRNVFSMFGGVPEMTIIREGRLRCQAAFRHPILAGTFGATSLALFVGLWFQPNRKKWLTTLAVFSALIIVFTASSGGALLTAVLAVAGLCLWPMRRRLSLVRRGILVAVVTLTILMQAPVWYVFSRLSNVVGGTGWYRSYLIETTAAHISEWWLCGTTYTAHWAPACYLIDPDHIDITSQYVAEAVNGGILKLALFVWILIESFRAIGRRIQTESLRSSSAEVMWWTLGVCLFSHCISFWSIPYFDQMAILWSWLLACIARLAYVPQGYSHEGTATNTWPAGLGAPCRAGSTEYTSGKL